jgi:hypothetical protein
MAIVKANYVKRGKGEKGRAKKTIRYITHRRDRDGHTVTRELFGYDGSLTKEQTYRMIDEARRGTLFYRIVLSPAPKQEDRYKDLNLRELTLDTMLKLEERLGQPVQFVATIHDDHAPHRHMHTLVLVQGRRLTREDFQALRLEATKRALSQRRLRDRMRGYRLQRSRTRTNRRSHPARHAGRSRMHRGVQPYQSYSCSLWGYHQALPASPQGYRCPACGLKLRRERSDRFRLPRRKERGWGLELSLSP